MILLVIAFFIYWIFNPSWASRLWYNVRTFPQRITSWMSSSKEFLDYESYKIKTPLDDLTDNNDNFVGDVLDSDIPDEKEKDIKEDENKVKEEDENEEKLKIEESDENEEWKKIRWFPKSIDFISIPEINYVSSETISWLTWYSKSDLLWVINKYLEENLDDDTDVLVTVEYDDESSDPQKIILQTRKKSMWEEKSAIVSWDLLDTIFNEIRWGEFDKDKTKKYIEKDNSNGVSNDYVKNVDQSVKMTTSTKLTQKEQNEAEEIFWILF